jgi:GNAT superfamily N-acetyltransferase
MIKCLAAFEKEPDAVLTTVESMERDFAAGAFGFVVAEANTGGCCGFALYHHRYSTWTGRCLFLEDIYVDEGARGTGVGRELFLFVVALAARMDVARLQWQVLNWNAPAIDFYKRFEAHVTSEWLNCKLVREQLHAMSAKIAK